MDLDKELLRKAGLGFAAMTEVVVYTCSGYLAGQYLDKKLNTGYWLTVVFTLVGLAAGFYRLYWIATLDETKRKNGNVED